MVKLFDLCYSEYAWDSLSKWFIVQFYFTKTIATMQKSNGKSVAFFGNKGLLSQALNRNTTLKTVNCVKKWYNDKVI
ncbi:hypothetical protein B7692_07405 [Streptococcus mitis]|uniref:Uncharacterized protein n=1 Tax=Streptococcus mitis TaxID=28037 RepID=A0A1X1L5E6_STRMT|nr:hypothetical protein [Streptococcus mitis]ORP06936.1 hypothetical protein B7692_07405 [Streptococcus mitis]